MEIEDAYRDWTECKSLHAACTAISQGGIYRRYIKRPMDFVLSLCVIVVLSSALLITAILVQIKLDSPVIFKQKRPGLNEKIFTLYKFRTMTDERGKDG